MLILQITVQGQAVKFSGKFENLYRIEAIHHNNHLNHVCTLNTIVHVKTDVNFNLGFCVCNLDYRNLEIQKLWKAITMKYAIYRKFFFTTRFEYKIQYIH